MRMQYSLLRAAWRASPRRFCHCDMPLFNNTWGGLCQRIQCSADVDCRAGGDVNAHCNLIFGTYGDCICDAPYTTAPRCGAAPPPHTLVVRCASSALRGRSGQGGRAGKGVPRE